MKLKLGAEVAALNPDVTDARLPGPSKFGNRKAYREGEEFDSEAEARRYDELCLLQRAGDITRLVTHPTYRLKVNGIEICGYEADFEYLRGGQRVVEDVKGMRTPAYTIKKKLMLACLGISIVEVEP